MYLIISRQAGRQCSQTMLLLALTPGKLFKKQQLDSKANARSLMMHENWRGVLQDRNQIRGTVMCLQASMMNHDCLPNTARFDCFDAASENNMRLSFRALQDIPAGEEITHQYFPLDWPLEERQQQCQYVFGFDCTCARCKVRR